MPKLIASNQITLIDLNDAIITGTAPANPTKGTLWIKDTVNPNELYKWSGTAWVLQTLSIESLDPVMSDKIKATVQSLLDISADNKITQSERIDIKDRVTAIIGSIPSDTQAMPTSATLDTGLKGAFYSVRKEALNVGVLSTNAVYVDVATKYTALKTELDKYSPKVYDTASAVVLTIASVLTWRNAWINYYESVNRLSELTSSFVKTELETIKTNHDTSLKVLDGKIEARVTTSQYTVDKSGIETRLSGAESSIIQSASQIQSKVSQLEVDKAVEDAKKYVQSRTENLVTNGTGLLGDNTNFKSFAFDGSQVYAGGGSFHTNRQNATLFSDELIPIDASQKYRMTAKAKSKTGLGNHYIGLVSYDIDGQSISPYHFYSAGKKVTALAKDLKVGDTEIHLIDSTGFVDSITVADHNHSINFWGYKNSFGYEYPVGTYTRRGFYIGWNKGAINRTTHVITLNKPFTLKNPEDENGIFKAGHQVSPTSSGGSYQYMTASNVKYPTDSWGSYSGEITGNGVSSNKFPDGTAFIKLLFLTNRNTSGGEAGDESWYSSVEFYNITQEEKSKDYTTAQILPLTNRVAVNETSITQTKDEIKSLATKQSVNDLTGRMSTAESSIVQQAGQIQSKVTQTDVNNSIKADNTLLDTRGDNQLPSWYFVNYPRQVISEFKSRSTIGVSGTATYGTLTTNVPWTGSSGGVVVQEFRSSDGTFERKSNAGATAWFEWVQIEDTAGSQAKVTAGIAPINTRLTTAESSITQQAGMIQSKVSQTDFDKLEIGGRNLITNTQFPTDSVKYTHTNKSGEGGLAYPLLAGTVISGQDYTISMKIRGNANAVIYRISSSGNSAIDFVSPSNLSETEYILKTLTFQSNRPELTSIYIFTKYRTTAYNEWFEIKSQSLKLERGNKATDWTSAPEDIDGAIGAVKTRITTAETSITQTANEIKSLATKSSVDGLTGRVSTAESQIIQQAGLIQSKVSQSAFDNMVVGARNLISGNPLNIKDRVSKDNWRYMDVTDAVMEVGETYTFSWNYSVISTTIPNLEDGIEIHIGTGKKFIALLASASIKAKRMTFVWEKEWSEEFGNGFAYKLSDWIMADEDSVIDYWSIQLEKGNMRTDWTPSPEDVKGQIDNVENRVIKAETSITQTADSIVSLASKTELISGRVSTAESQIVQQANLISQTVTQKYFDDYKFNVVNLVNNPATTGNATGWTTDGGGVLGVESQSFNGSNMNVLAVRSTGSSQVYSEYFDVDPTKSYEVSIWIKSEQPVPNTSHAYFGVNSLGSTAVESIASSTGIKGADSSNFYFWYVGASTKLDDWYKVTAYILPTGFDPAKAKNLGENATTHARMKPIHTKFRIRWLNWANTGATPRKMWVANPVVREVPAEMLGNNNDRIIKAETSITQTSESIKLLATKSSVDLLTGKMSSAESSITQTANEIATKVSKTDYNGNTVASMINQSATTISIQASKINLVGAVTVLSDISGNLGTITAGNLNLSTDLRVGNRIYLAEGKNYLESRSIIFAGSAGITYNQDSMTMSAVEMSKLEAGEVELNATNTIKMVGNTLNLSGIRGSINWGSHKPVAVWG